jgi:hypothetical protein
MKTITLKLWSGASRNQTVSNGVPAESVKIKVMQMNTCIMVKPLKEPGNATTPKTQPVAFQSNL